MRPIVIGCRKLRLQGKKEEMGREGRFEEKCLMKMMESRAMSTRKIEEESRG